MSARGATDEKQLQRLGREVSRALASDEGAAIPAARRKLFEAAPPRASHTSRSFLAVGGVAAAAAVAFAVWWAPAGRSVTTQATPATAPAGDDGAPLRPLADARSEPRTGDDGSVELVLEAGEARGRLGAPGGPQSLAAGPYRITGEASVLARWSDAEGLFLEALRGEARVLTPGRAPLLVGAGTTRRFPPQP